MGMPLSPRRLAQGAACAIVDGTFPPGDEERLVRVGETLQALNDLGRASRARATRTKVIAVTGSAGKTGTKEALPPRAGAERLGACLGQVLQQSLGGAVVARQYAARPSRYGVFEIGMNHAGEIDVLTRLVRPADRHRHHRGAGASRLFPLGRGDRRCQG